MIPSIPLITPPSVWRDLQKKVAKILTGCGFETAVEKRIDTVRGSVVIDVHAEKAGSNQGKVLCECKHWNRRVTKIMVHAFRTVLGDSGSSQGIIISKNGFQKGAYEAARYANLCLYSWAEFVAAFTLDYLQYTIDRNHKKGYELRMLVNDIIQLSDHHPFLMSPVEVEGFQAIRNGHADYLFYSFREHYEDIQTMTITRDEVERGIKVATRDLNIAPESIDEFFDYIYERCRKAVEQVEDLLKKLGNKVMEKEAS